MAVFGVYVKIWGCNPFDFVLTILLNRSIDQFGNDNWSVFFLNWGMLTIFDGPIILTTN